MEVKPIPLISPSEHKETKYNPLVSIVTPVRNGIKYLETCIKSVLNQSYPNIEHIFVDGGSTDGTLEMLADYQARHPERIRFISGQDRGVGDAVNKGLRIARGAIFGWIDSDDIYELDAIRTVVEFFRAHPEASFVYGGCNMMNDKSEVIASFIIKDFDLREWLNHWHYIVFCAAFYKRLVVERVGYFNTLGNDLDFWIRVHKHFTMHRIDRVLSNWRLHSEGISMKRNEREDKIRRERIRQDFVLLLKHGGNLCSPRAKRYYSVVISKVIRWLQPLVAWLRPVLGWAYPALNRAAQFLLRMALGD